MSEYLFYSVLLGAALFGVTWGISRSDGLAWLISISAGAFVIIFFFGDPKTTRTLGDIANNLTLAITKVIWAAGWLAGTWGVSFVISRAKP